MDPNLIMGLGTAGIAALSAILAAAITGYWGYCSVRATSEESKLKEGNNNLKRELVAAYRQIAAFHRTEDQMALHIAETKRIAVKTVKTQFRDLACPANEERPKFTAKSAMQRAYEIETT